MHLLHISIPLVCLFYHFVMVVLTIVNYVVFIRYQDTRREMRDAYLAFSIIEAVSYGAAAAPLFVYAYKYGKSSGARVGRLLGGIAIMFFTSSLPIFIIELIQLFNFGTQIRYPLDGIVFALHSLAAAVGSFAAWFGYLRFIARKIQNWRGPERQIVEDADTFPGKGIQLGFATRSQEQPEKI